MGLQKSYKIVSGVFMFIQFECSVLSFLPKTEFYGNITRIKGSIDATIVNTTHDVTGVIECQSKCKREIHESMYYLLQDRKCLCNSDLDRNVDHDDTSDIIYGIFNTLVKISDLGRLTYKFVPLKYQCLDLHLAGVHQDGVYPIDPSAMLITEAWCDMSDGGWTVFQRRINGEVEFYRGWEDYKHGFGVANGEYWLGLEHVHVLTTRPTEMKIELETFGDTNPLNSTSQYEKFIITSEEDGYRILVYGFSGSCGDPVASDGSTNSNNSAFSTFDRDNDNSLDDCAVLYEGCWWHKDCFESSLNGRYHKKGEPVEYGRGVISAACWNYLYSLEKTVMKLRKIYGQ